MLTCKDVAERVAAYLDRRLTWREWCAFLLHLAMCLFCRRYVAQMRATRAMLRKLGELGRGEALDDSLRRAFRAWRDERAAR
jgi:hypothetical protein